MATGTFFNAEPQLTVETKNFDNQTATKDTFTAFSWDISKSNFQAIGLVGLYIANASSSGSNATFLTPYDFHVNISEQKAYLKVRNYSTSNNAKFQVTFYVLYRRL